MLEIAGDTVVAAASQEAQDSGGDYRDQEVKAWKSRRDEATKLRDRLGSARLDPETPDPYTTHLLALLKPRT